MAGGVQSINNINILILQQCPPCRGFTPKLVDCYKKIQETHKNFEIIFVSSDSDEEHFDEYWKEMPWMALPFGDDRKQGLAKHFSVSGNYLGQYVQGVSKKKHSENKSLRLLDRNFTINTYIPVGVIFFEYIELYPISIWYLHPEIVI